MVTRTLYFGNPAYLSLTNKQLVVTLPDAEKSDLPKFFQNQQSKRTIPIEDIGMVVLDHKQITITQGVIEQLLANNVAILSCDSSHLPTGLMLPMEGHSEQTEHYRNQMSASMPLTKQLWQQVIRAKIRNQATLLKQLQPDADIEFMLALSENVRSGDNGNYEAQAAAWYWGNFFNTLPDFRRDRDGFPPNNLLNYGYAIVRATMARAIVSAGMLPSLGIFHRNKYNAYCLADDMMEPYRLYVDRIVYQIVTSGQDYTELTTELKKQLLSLPATDVTINGLHRPLMVAVQQSATGLYKCYKGEAKQIPFPMI